LRLQRRLTHRVCFESSSSVSPLLAQAVRLLDELVDGLPTKPVLRDTAEENAHFGVSSQVTLGVFADTTTPGDQLVEVNLELIGDLSEYVLGWNAPIIFNIT